MKRLIVTGVLSAVLAAASTGVVAAAPSPNGPGQPGAPATTCFSSPSTANSPGGTTTQSNSSVFNGGGTASANYAGNPDTQSLAHANSTLAVSQYDIACFQVTSGH